MSAALLGLALKAKLHSQTRKMVLIKLVDCCHEDGTRIYPSLATIAEDAECSVPTARRVMQSFVRVGLLRLVKEGGSGAKSTNHYEMDVDLLARLRRPEYWPALEAAAVHQPLPDADDRLGSKHPTVKPVDLKQWLCRMVTPSGGTVLDPFAGTGTTGEAAFREGFRAVLIEREEAYQADIARRMDLALAGPASRKAARAKARATDEDAGPLFAGEKAA